MAQIVINEISQNYSYSVGTASYATVAMPITACWGPAYVDPESVGKTQEELLETITWQKFPATQSGLESFVATYRGPASNYRIAGDYSYYMAMTLIAAGYDVLVCRVCPGTHASGKFTVSEGNALHVTAKYPGTFGNNLQVVLQKVVNTNYWNIITYVVDTSGVRTAVENLTFVFDIEHSTDSILYIDELESNFLTLTIEGTVKDDSTFAETNIRLGSGEEAVSGSDTAAVEELADAFTHAKTYATARYEAAGYAEAETTKYISALTTYAESATDATRANTIMYNEWVYTAAYAVYDLLKDKLSYNPNRVISPGWDDQNILVFNSAFAENLTEISPLHIKLLDVAYNSRCATGYIDVPKCLPRAYVWDTDATNENQNLGYAQRLARYLPNNADLDINTGLYSSHCAFFAPWGQYTYAGTSKVNDASPSFLALMIQRAMILNQSIQYEWALPTNRRHNLNIGKMAYTVPKKLLDQWQSLEGVGVNAITAIPDLGTSIWGNSTLFEVPPATYQALANLSTRLLVNAVEDLAYRCGLSITFQYNNEEAYSSFYAGMVPLLDTMKNVGAVEDYRIQMSADIDANSRINANSVIGKIFLVVPGVINDIYIDLIALPSGTDLDDYIS